MSRRGHERGVSACHQESDVTLDLDLGSIGIRQPRSSIRRLALTPIRRDEDLDITPNTYKPSVTSVRVFSFPESSRNAPRKVGAQELGRKKGSHGVHGDRETFLAMINRLNSVLNCAAPKLRRGPSRKLYLSNPPWTPCESFSFRKTEIR